MKPELFGLFDILTGVAWGVILFGLGFWFYLSRSDQPHYKWFIPNLAYHILFGLLFGFAYAVVIPEGGDTLAYHDGAYHLSELFWQRPFDYFSELFTTPSGETIRINFDAEIGYPPSWIYREPESFFVSKIFSIFSIVSFNSYIALTIISSTLTAIASWKLFTTLRNLKFCPQWILIVATMFVPTVAFWCSGVAKDSFVLSSFYILFAYIFPISIGREELNLKKLLIILFAGFILYHLRSYMLVALAIPIGSALLIRWAKRINNNPVLLTFYRVTIGGVVLVFLAVFSQTSSGEVGGGNDVLQEVIVIQKDFAQNKTYDGYRYDLGITDYSTWGMIKATPMAIITAFYRPFLWEANSAFLLVSGLESLLLLFLTFKFFVLSGNLGKQLAFIGKQEFLVFAILFALILGFFVGFTSGLFNVLVRFKAPIVVFIMIFFASSRKFMEKNRSNQ